MACSTESFTFHSRPSTTIPLRVAAKGNCLASLRRDRVCVRAADQDQRISLLVFGRDFRVLDHPQRFVLPAEPLLCEEVRTSLDESRACVDRTTSCRRQRQTVLRALRAADLRVQHVWAAWKAPARTEFAAAGRRSTRAFVHSKRLVTSRRARARCRADRASWRRRWSNRCAPVLAAAHFATTRMTSAGFWNARTRSQ